MTKVLFSFLTIAILASCGNSFNIKGTSDISVIDGQKLYLKVIEDNQANVIDSCEVIHGAFNFKGDTDTTKLAGIFMGEENLLMFILEDGEININISQQGNTVGGTELNDTLYNFFKDMSSYTYKFEELDSRGSAAIMDGKDLDEVNSMLEGDRIKLETEKNTMISNFISKNYDNILGPSIFMLVTSSIYRYPIIDNWIEEIMAQATDRFKNDSYVKDFYEKAQENQEIMNGMRTPSSEIPGENQYSNP